MLKHCTQFVVRENAIKERFPTNTETKVYEFEGLSLDDVDLHKRWRYLGRHYVDDADNVKVILTESSNIYPTKRRPFNFFTKTEWSLGKLFSRFPEGIHQDQTARMSHEAPRMSHEAPLGTFIVYKKIIWKRKAYRSVSEPGNEDEVSDKILCFFERHAGVTDTDMHQASNHVISAIQNTACLNKHLLGMTIYKNISGRPTDVPYVDLVVEFTITAGRSYPFKPLLDTFFLQFQNEIVFFYGLYKRHELIDNHH